ncbi:unnamed protein product [Didymodactylos carnosus]|uniref:Urocanate hydratase n=1 Tax=Didymodactylos carnosus TaxID=1234261 RepID=A0A813NJJ1_9BILA|nr:unnamed protein product [Didymodactylos carnosus]CAF0750025.1 unnamed protein product [Didymodactylos carnosus]CAF3517267.1 unnamed protein product [Didymodactylos carnosus]CAF3528550.1 unnamed protein product [Didymodactylos carnosus]
MGLPLSPLPNLLAIKNALRYFPTNIQHSLIAEFQNELKQYGHIYMYRFKPNIEMKAYPIDEYPCVCKQAAGIMLMIMNNLDKRVAQFPYELITYGGNGQVFSNWAQFLLVMHYLSIMNEKQILIMYSGHPLGLFPTRAENSPRMVITNGMVVPNYSSSADYERMFALGVTMYGQMTAGSYCYIGPQGIVHGTFITIMNAARKRLNTNDLRGRVFVSSGLGGMSGAQAKAAMMLGCIGVIAEVSKEAAEKRYQQGWCSELIDDMDNLISRIKECKQSGIAIAIGYLGNIVDVWERLAKEFDQSKELLVDLGSDQTSCHNPYYGADVGASHATSHCIKFKYPSYVQDIMGNIFSLGFGPFRWVCASCSSSDLAETDRIAENVIQELMADKNVPQNVMEQYEDNLKWIRLAANANLVVGSQARILYSDQIGRIKLGLAFNEAVRNRRIGPVVLSRDHHDVSGTDSPYRETSNIEDGSAFCADMAVQNAIGDSFRGATWIALHNGGGVGWGEVMNGGFGMFLDGSEKTDQNIREMLYWDVLNGVSRRSWSGNANASQTIRRAMEVESNLNVTLPNNLSAECEKMLRNDV